MADEDDKKGGLFGKIATGVMAGTGGVFGGPLGFAAGKAAGKGLESAAEKRRDKRALRKEEGGRIKPIKQSKEMLRDDLETLRKDPMSLGMGEAERQQMIGEATAQAGALQQAQTSQLAQAALAGQGFQQGAFTDAAEGIAAGGEQAAATAARDAANLNRQIVNQETSRIRQALAAERDRAKENTRFWTQFGIDSAGAVVGAAMGLPGVGEAAGALLTGGGGAAAAAPAVPADPDLASKITMGS